MSDAWENDPELQSTRKVERRELERMLVGGSDHSFGDVGPYKLKGVLGRGGSAIVYRAEDRQGGEVALKVFTETPALKAADLQRFLLEAAAVSKLRSHPNIITVHDTGSEGKNHYIAMELVPEGRTLKQLLAERSRLPQEKVVEYGLAIGKALAYAHREGFIHRDIKPGNILINSFNQPLLTDFGLVHAPDSHLTMAGEIVGTPIYMAPEQLVYTNPQTSVRSDIYSFGLLLYFMLTGSLPYEADQKMPLAQIIEVLRDCEPTRLSALGIQASPQLEAVLLKLLEKDPDDRYQTMDAVVTELEACQTGTRVKAHIPTRAERLEKWLKKHRAVTLTAMSATVLLLSVCWYLLHRSEERQSEGLALAIETVRSVEYALAEKRRLEAIVNPESSEKDESKGEKHWGKARKLLSGGNLAEAGKEFGMALAWGRKNGRRHLVQLCRADLARISLAQGRRETARGEFLALAKSQGPKTLKRQLWLFEAGVAAWLAGDRQTARGHWGRLTFGTNSTTTLANPQRRSYIIVLGSFMLGQLEAGELRDAMAAVPMSLRALGFWALAQKSSDPPDRRELLRKAASRRKCFVWITQEE